MLPPQLAYVRLTHEPFFRLEVAAQSHFFLQVMFILLPPSPTDRPTDRHSLHDTRTPQIKTKDTALSVWPVFCLQVGSAACRRACVCVCVAPCRIRCGGVVLVVLLWARSEKRQEGTSKKSKKEGKMSEQKVLSAQSAQDAGQSTHLGAGQGAGQAHVRELARCACQGVVSRVQGVWA